MANNWFKQMPQKSSPAILKIKIPYLNLFIGWLILIRIINPTTHKSMVDAVATSEAGIENTSPQTTSEPTINTSVSPARKAFNYTFRKKRHSIRLLFVSKASKNPGAPMVNILMREICAGSNG